jgi:hypothetical protein
MKPVRINFVAPTAYKGVWAVAAGVVLVIAGSTAWQLWQGQQTRQALHAEMTQRQAEAERARLERERLVPETPVVNPRAGSERAAARLLQRDWNGLFDTLENTQLPGVRLVSASLDAASGQARVEYELERMEQGSEVTEALNAASVGQAVWLLERLDGDGGAGKVRGVWRAVMG